MLTEFCNVVSYHRILIFLVNCSSEVIVKFQRNSQICQHVILGETLEAMLILY